MKLHHVLTIGDRVVIRATSRVGEIRAVLFEAHTGPQYRVVFLTTSGDLARDWFHEDELRKELPASAVAKGRAA